MELEEIINPPTRFSENGRVLPKSKIRRPIGMNCQRAAVKLRRELISCVSREDIHAITLRLIADARTGDNNAVNTLFDRLWGKPKQEVSLESSIPLQAIQIIVPSLTDSAKSNSCDSGASNSPTTLGMDQGAIVPHIASCEDVFSQGK